MHQVLIFLPLLAALLDVLNVLPTPFGRVLVLATLLVGAVAALRRPGFKWSTQLMRSALISLAGALATFVLSTRLGLGTVVASALVGLVGSRLVKDREQLVMYLGAFVGMSSALRFPTFPPLIAAGLLGGLFFELTDECWVGVGGRLGTIAASSVVVVLSLIGGLG
ncbi:MAG: hypothetical protein GX971_03615 [Firmicutes bacterium]|nr:hypothetical protein [Bacillota bacterium]